MCGVSVPKYFDVPSPAPLKVMLPSDGNRDPRVDELAALGEKLTQDLQIQFTRIALLQADIDLIRSAWTSVQPKTPSNG